MRRFLAPVIFAALLSAPTAWAEANKFRRRSENGAAVLREMNLARQHPDIYVRYLEGLRPRFRAGFLVLPGRTMLRAREGVAAIDEAIRFLQNARPIAVDHFARHLSRRC